MRVIAGEAKGRRLQVPRGLAVRPSASRLREALFGILESRDAIAGARVLDLFAGTGALGLEALSRGASSLTAVEKDRSVARILRDNLERCGFSDRARVVERTVETHLAGLPDGERFDLVLVDPPYREGLADVALRSLASGDRLASGEIVVVEHARGEAITIPAGLRLDTERRYGDSLVSLYRPADALAAAREGTHVAH